MSAIPENVDYEIAKIWLSQQNLEDLSPEQAKELFFDALHKIEKQNVERWD